MHAEINELFQMAALLGKDADAAREEVDRTRSEYSKRAYVRALFAWIEGTCFFLRRFVLSERLKQPISLETIPEIVALLEQKNSPDDGGKIKGEDLRTPTANNLLFSVTALARCQGFPMQVAKSKGWQAYRSALKIRDRITHPKRAQDLTITDDEIQTVIEAQGWFVGLLSWQQLLLAMK